MKYIIALLILALPLFSVAQHLNKDSLAESVISDLKDSWNLGINDDESQPLNIRVFNKFKTLFDSTATIDDEFNVIFKYDSLSAKSTYQLENNKLFDVYSHDVALQVMRLTIDTSIGKTNLISHDHEEFVYEIPRKVKASKYRKFVLEDAETYFDREIQKRKIEFTKDSINEKSKILNNSLYNNANATYEFESTDTLKVTLRVLNDSTVKIIKIQTLHGTIQYINDKDMDGILTKEDINDTIPGDFTANGIKDSDFDGVPDGKDGCKEIFGSSKNRGCPVEFFNNNFSVFIFTGIVGNSRTIKLPEADNLGYADIDPNQSQKGTFSSSGGDLSTIYGGEFSYYFGKRAKHFGLSIGLNYNGFNTSYTMEDAAVNTFKYSDGQNDYRRRVTTKSGSVEKISYHVLNFPLLFKYRVKLGKKENENKKWSMELSAGPSFIYFNNSSDYNVNMDFEGLYQVDTISKDKFTWYDYFDNGSSYNVFLTADGINSQSETPGSDVFFNLLDSSGYDFAGNKNYEGKDKKATRMSVALNVNCDLSYKVNDFMDVKFGACFVIAPTLQSASHYTPMYKTTDEYNSLYRSNTKSLYMSYGLHAGIVIVLDKLDKKLGL